MNKFLVPLVLSVLLCTASLGAPPSTRIVNGTDASIAHIPFQVSLEFYNMHTCGGAILNPEVVITAAHCLDYMTEHHTVDLLRVRVGSSDLQNGGTLYQIRETITHELYQSTTYDYDVALLKLASPMSFGEFVQPVMLATNRASLAANSMVQVSGWGRVMTGGPLSPVLQKISMPVLEQSECENMFQRINPITERMFCAGFISGEGDSCSGDSGGPLVNSQNILYGLVSWGPSECAMQGYVGVYTNVAFFNDWIMAHW